MVTEVSDCCWQGLYAMSMNCLDSAEAQFKTALSVSRNLYVNTYSKQCCHLVFIKYNYYIWILVCSYHATRPSARLSVSIWLSCLYVWSDKRNLYRSSKTLTLISWRSGEHIATPVCWHLCSYSLRKTVVLTVLCCNVTQIAQLAGVHVVRARFTVILPSRVQWSEVSFQRRFNDWFHNYRLGKLKGRGYVRKLLLKKLCCVCVADTTWEKH